MENIHVLSSPEIFHFSRNCMITINNQLKNQNKGKQTVQKNVASMIKITPCVSKRYQLKHEEISFGEKNRANSGMGLPIFAEEGGLYIKVIFINANI